MKNEFPIIISNGQGEVLTFTGLVPEGGAEKLLGYNQVMPGSGPPMHVHWLQDEGFTVLNGRIGYQVAGEETRYAGPGESVTFKRGVPHRFWNAGTSVLECEAWVMPAHNFVFFLSSIFKAQQKSGSARPDMFDMAFMLRRYRSEFDMPGLPFMVRKIMMPLAYFTGKILGKYRKYRDAPAPVRAG